MQFSSKNSAHVNTIIVACIAEGYVQKKFDTFFQGIAFIEKPL